MISLTDMWRTAGGDKGKIPYQWRILPTTKEFVDHIISTTGKSISDNFTTKTEDPIEGPGRIGIWLCLTPNTSVPSSMSGATKSFAPTWKGLS